MKIPCFNGSHPLGLTFKINHFLNFHDTQEEHVFQSHLFIWMGPLLTGIGGCTITTNWRHELIFYMNNVFILRHPTSRIHKASHLN